MFFPVSEWFPSFLLTLAVEAPIVIALLRPFEPSVLRLAALIVFANLATHLAVWYVLTQLFMVDGPAYVPASEAWAIGAEMVFYLAAIRGLSARRALAVAIAANVASLLVGRAGLAMWPDLLGR